MNLRERFDQMEPREQKLLTVLVIVFVVMVVFLVPVLVSATIASRKDDNEALREAINSIVDAKVRINKREQEEQSLQRRYSRPAPPLAGYLDKLATANGIEIPESQDRAPVPHGKRFEERSTKLVLSRVGMKNLATFFEKIDNSGHPVRISSLNLRKRPTDPDSYDVTVTISAFDRKEAPKEAAKTAGGAEGDEQAAEEEEEEE